MRPDYICPAIQQITQHHFSAIYSKIFTKETASPGCNINKGRALGPLSTNLCQTKRYTLPISNDFTAYAPVFEVINRGLDHVPNPRLNIPETVGYVILSILGQLR